MMKIPFHTSLAPWCAILSVVAAKSNAIESQDGASIFAKIGLDTPNDSLMEQQACGTTELFELGGDDDDVSSFVSESSYKVEAPAPLTTDDELGADLGEPQKLDPIHVDAIVKLVDDARSYIENEVMMEDKYDLVRDMCQNKHELCAFWAVLGECDKNPGYMTVNCAPVCRSCEQLHVETRCPMDPDAVDAFQRPGDLNRMFERITTDPSFQQYEPVVLSRPTYAPGDTKSNATYKIGMWMVMFENIVTDEEANRMIELGHKNGYERSSDVGEERADGTHEQYVNSGRTSTNAWCTDDCYEDAISRRLMERVENITGIPETNSENFQLLRYEEGQFYQTHNDYVPYQRDRPSGVRILTFYFYLNDVPQGGGTNFPKLDMTVKPKRGRAVLWPSVLDEDPNQKDGRSDHQALAVVEGVKFGCNAWIHQRDFKGPNGRGC